MDSNGLLLSSTGKFWLYFIHSSIAAMPESMSAPFDGTKYIPLSAKLSNKSELSSFSRAKYLESPIRSNTSTPSSSSIIRNSSTQDWTSYPIFLEAGPNFQRGSPKIAHSPQLSRSGHSLRTVTYPLLSTAAHRATQFLAPAGSTTWQTVWVFSLIAGSCGQVWTFVLNDGNSVFMLLTGMP